MARTLPPVEEHEVAAAGASGWGLLEAGRRMGAHTWVEQRLFEVAGAWSAATADPEARVLLAVLSRHHGWRAEQWWALLPRLADLQPEEQVAPPSPDAARALDDLAAAQDGEARLVAIYDGAVLGLADAYEDHAARCHPSADAPTARVLGQVLADVRLDLAAAADRLDRARLVAPAPSAAELRRVLRHR